MANFCIHCGTTIDSEDKFCPKCGKGIKKENDALDETFDDSEDKEAWRDTALPKSDEAPEDKQDARADNGTPIAQDNNGIKVGELHTVPKHIKKKQPPVVIFIGVIAVICVIVVLLISLGDEPTKTNGVSANDEANAMITDAERQKAEDVEFILNRKVFIFKTDFPEVYSAGINDIDSMNAYSDDWAMSNVLNDTNFRNIRWTSENATEGVRLVTFSGDSTNMPYNATVSVEFYVQDGAKVPLATSLKIVTDKDTTDLTVQKYLDTGMDNDQAFVSTDATICMMIVFFADDAVDGAANSTNNPSWKDEYGGLIDACMRDYPNYQYSCNYTLYDIDEDGVPEIFIKLGTCEADYELRVFTIEADTNMGPILIDTLPGGHASICGIATKNAFLLWGGHQGYETITKVTLQNDVFNDEVIFEAEVQNYHELTALTSYELNDRSGLNWNGNPLENNQYIIDNYSIADNTIPEPEITTENFEDKVRLIRRSDWYDNGIFSTYFDACDHNNDVTWSYIGTVDDTFGLSYYDYLQMDVYRVDFPDGWKTYMLVPFNENIGNPPVVFLFFDSNEVPMEIWRGDQ